MGPRLPSAFWSRRCGGPRHAMEDGRRCSKAVAGWSWLRQSGRAFAGPLTSYRAVTRIDGGTWRLALLASGDDERRCVGQITWVSHGTSRASPKAAPGGTSKAFAPNTAAKEHNAQIRTKLEGGRKFCLLERFKRRTH